MRVASLCPLPVGVVAWPASQERATVVLKATFSLEADGEATLASEQLPLAAEPAGAVEAPRTAADDAPWKARADVVLVGHARRDEPSRVLGARVAIDGWEKRFFAIAAAPAKALPLTGDALRAYPAEAAPAAPVGPRPIDPAAWEVFAEGRAPLDFGLFNVAPPDQRLPLLNTSTRLVLEGLVRGAPLREVRLPGLRPVLFWVSPDAPPLEMAPRCDTLVVDTDRALCTVTWRCIVTRGEVVPEGAYLAVALAERTAKPSFRVLQPELDAVERRLAVDLDALRRSARDAVAAGASRAARRPVIPRATVRLPRPPVGRDDDARERARSRASDEDATALLVLPTRPPEEVTSVLEGFLTPAAAPPPVVDEATFDLPAGAAVLAPPAIVDAPPAEAEATLLAPEVHAAVQVALWRGASLEDALAPHGLTLVAWHLEERRQTAALAREATEGRADRALALYEALGAARASRGSLN
jgi:hypothetical protein